MYWVKVHLVKLNFEEMLVLKCNGVGLVSSSLVDLNIVRKIVTNPVEFSVSKDVIVVTSVRYGWVIES